MRRWLSIAAISILATAAEKPVELAVHLVVACSGDALVKVKIASGGTQCLDAKPFLTDRDVESAEVQKNSKGHPVIFLTFRNEAAIRELKITRQNIGNPVAILLNGRVVFVPTISAASRFLYIDGDFKQEQAVTLVTAFNRQSRR
ncbi:MAG TPA: hypothetical protein VG456_27795 [Candidatus Sulfopaludibacter sp.]|jgi:preprotein translocase subunit SecD|nr:hypothetical protein [Candidatus Sulfopaludibacter sp.]